MPVDKEFDKFFRNQGYRIIAGVDEAGRGPLAGPVVAAAVILNEKETIEGIDDSKKLNARKRYELFNEIKLKALSFSYAVLNNEEIDKVNILNASLTAMLSSVEMLKTKPQLILVDGNKKIKTALPCFAVVKGDAKSESIAAASIVAKVIRDQIMDELDTLYPGYGWSKNKGYPTGEHREAIIRLGITPLHRKTFLRKMEQYELFGKK